MNRLLISLLLLFVGHSLSADKIKIACVGNSITYGARIVNRDQNSYPAQLQHTLGGRYQVKNFGLNGRTLLSTTDKPYIREAAYSESLEFLPDIVIIKLGTNDSKASNVDKLPGFSADYQRLIDSYKALSSQPRIILCLPVYCYHKHGPYKDSNATYQSIINPAIEQLAYDNNIEIVDLFHLFSDSYKGYLMPDSLHPSSIGAGMIAQRLSSRIQSEFATDFKLIISEDRPFNFHGYRGYNLDENCKIVAPRYAAKGNPWVLRARFWDHQPQVDIALLENGFHIAYCDVAALFGAKEAMSRYDKFYNQMVDKGLSSKVVLETMSRGGLVSYRWAAQHPERVAAIYADAPVLDIKSWPLAHADNQTIGQMMAAYGFKNRQQAERWAGNPLDLYRHYRQIPILHVVGDQDSIVPPSENSNILEARLKEIGGSITTIRKPSCGHHPHALFAPQPIVNFILQHTGLYQNPAIIPVPGNEYRASAGFKVPNEWHSIAQEIADSLAVRKVDVLLLGNSITMGFVGSRKLIGGRGKKAFDHYFDSWECAGISGDQTQHLLWRLQNHHYEQSQPKVVVITIGVNNLGSGESAEGTAAGIIAVAAEAQQRFADSRIILFGILPCSQYPDHDLRIKHDKVHQILAQTAFAPRVEYVDARTTFLEADGSQRQELYTPDRLHLSTLGYQAWSKLIHQLVNR